MIVTYEDFKKEIYHMSGIDLNCYKERQMKRRIDALIKKNNYNDYHSYVLALKDNKELYNEFINYLTINVSQFFRNPSQWEVLEKEIIPYLLKSSSDLKIWSAACSTGDEPYSLVMLLSKFIPLSKIKILATDIDKEALEKAKMGLYNDKSIEGMPKEFFNKFFKPVGEFFQISEEVKKCVTFEHHNLLSDRYPQNCDLIVCRNVLIYFTEEAKNNIYKNFNKSLKMDAILFVGSTEQIIMSHRYGFTPVKSFFYKKIAEL
ncbi:MAG: protein-glutamate O-methyltransferase CheR [Epulopiscium sp.]|nr:protein-glutamate O-methyltransferase CheR [Candidatus Epulonipiscium sp.]HOQ16182.1 protein-glutamate O-methyltransferase CheR [Defluviitaleaceae bacterium]HPT75416.1 protein-glutamate O-methyltransferase CheR [Defluviitaleaceae bacterium]